MCAVSRIAGRKIARPQSGSDTVASCSTCIPLQSDSLSPSCRNDQHRRRGPSSHFRSTYKTVHEIRCNRMIICTWLPGIVHAPHFTYLKRGSRTEPISQRSTCTISPRSSSFPQLLLSAPTFIDVQLKIIDHAGLMRYMTPGLTSSRVISLLGSGRSMADHQLSKIKVSILTTPFAPS